MSPEHPAVPLRLAAYVFSAEIVNIQSRAVDGIPSLPFCSKVGGGNTAPAKPPQAAARPPNASLKLRFGGRGKPL